MSALIHPCNSGTGLLSHLAITLSSSTIMRALIQSVKGVGPTKKLSQGNLRSRLLTFWFSSSSRCSSQRKVDVYILHVLLPFLNAKQDGSRSKRCNPLQSYLGREAEKRRLKFSRGKRSNTQGATQRRRSLWSLMTWRIQFADSPRWQRWPRPPLHRFCSTGSVPTSPGCSPDTAPPPGQHRDKTPSQAVDKFTQWKHWTAIHIKTVTLTAQRKIR